MIEALLLLVSFLKSGLENQTELSLENLAHRQQLAILTRNRSHARLRWRDRLFWACLSSVWQKWRESPGWGYDRIQGALANLGHLISNTCVAGILKAHGIDPAPDRKRQSTWKSFLQAHWDVMASVDFTTIEVWTKGGLITVYLLFVMELATRRVHFAGSTSNPHEPWMLQVARNACDAEDGFLREKKYLLMDRDMKFSEAFRVILEGSGVSAVQLPPRSPNLSPNLERFMRSIKEECLERIIFFGEKSLQNAVADFLAHYHQERNHQGLNNQLIQPGNEVGCTTGEVACRERLGGMLRYYYRKQAA